MKKEYFGTSWSNYVERSLIPRLHGFELLMASYAMAHLKLDLLLMETGYKPTKTTQQRFKIFLTNSLEEYHQDTGTLFAQYLANESKEANRIKKNAPIMVVMGNPPYAVSSSNKSKWIQELIKDYKKNLNERKINLDDDYIKFIRYGQYYIDKKGEGILAYISNNSFIDGITHRQMRKSLLESFDKIYILDLHGNAKKKETAPDGSKDENVFDIQQGVSINIFIKAGKEKANQLSEVYHFDLFGKREDKYKFLSENDLNSIKWKKLKYKEPNYFLVPKNFEQEKKYTAGFKIDSLLVKYVSGFQTKRDKVTIKITKQELDTISDIFLSNKVEEIRVKLELPVDGRDWKIKWAKNDIIKNKPTCIQIMYRPFDERYTLYTGKSKGFVAYPRGEMLNNLNKENNLSLITCRQQSPFDFQHIFISRLISDMCNISSQTKETGYIFPLYIYPDEDSVEKARIPNLNLGIVKEIEKKLELSFIDDHENLKKAQHDKHFSPLDILDYIYAILHSPTYRETYKEFLKIDFPRVPYPDKKTFWQLVKLGGQLRIIHLLEDTTLDKRTIAVEGEGDDVITNRLTKNDFIMSKKKVALKINEQITLTNIPLVAWEFYIGGYQPAQKWLKDRIGRSLSMHDLKHYNRIINALVKTDKLMQQIEKIKII